MKWHTPHHPVNGSNVPKKSSHGRYVNLRQKNVKKKINNTKQKKNKENDGKIWVIRMMAKIRPPWISSCFVSHDTSAPFYWMPRLGFTKYTYCYNMATVEISSHFPSNWLFQILLTHSLHCTRTTKLRHKRNWFHRKLYFHFAWLAFQDPRIGFLWKYVAGEENIRTNLTWEVGMNMDNAEG